MCRGVGSDGRGKAQWLGVQKGKSAIFVGRGGGDRLHFSTGRSKLLIHPVTITENMTIKCRTTGFGLKRLGDGVDHVCMRSMVGSLLLLLTLTHRRQGHAGRRWTSGGVRGRQGRRCHGHSTGQCTPRRGGRNAAPLLPMANTGAGRAIFATMAGATTNPPPPPPTYTGAALGEERGAIWTDC